jgi:hypothetical protein
MTDTQILINAVAASIVYALSAYVKKTEKETFNEEKLFTTVLIGVIVGLYSYFTNSTLDAATQFFTSMGITVSIENWGKTVYRKIKKTLQTKGWWPTSEA